MDWDHGTISIRRQSELLGVNRASLYYNPLGESEENLRLMRWIDEQYTGTPFFGSRRMTAWLRQEKKQEVNRKRAGRLMEVLGLELIYPKPKLSEPGEGHKIYWNRAGVSSETTIRSLIHGCGAGYFWKSYSFFLR